MNSQRQIISINLLPAEYARERAKTDKLYKVQQFGTATLLALVFLASFTFVLRILQSQNIQEVEAKLNEAEGKVSDLKSKEATLFVLKNRLEAINKFSSEKSKQLAVYESVEKNLPSQISVTTVEINSLGSVLITLVAADAVSLDSFINGLMDPAADNSDTIDKISIESLNKSRDGFYRVNMKVEAKTQKL